jgi:mono/diheme cytochrome c family protein
MQVAARLLPLGAVALLLGSCAGADDKRAEGKRVFAEAGCAGCHTLADAKAVAKVGPDLDRRSPSVSTVVRQVKRGGNGMPSFDGKLEEKQILAVAQYVSGAARGGAATAAAEFKADETTLADCRAKADAACYEQAFGNLVFREGAKPALAELERTEAAPPPGFTCHRTAHAMGGAALSRSHGDVARAFVDGSPVCASGFYHGVLERAFAGVEEADLPAKARELCADPKLVAAPFLHFQCLHGLGHGLMIYTAYDLKLGLKTCDALPDAFGRDSCAGGVFMENVNTSYGTTSKWLKDDDLIFPCNTVAESHKYACYQLATARIRQVKRTWPEIARECLRSEPRWVEICFQSMGRDASGDAGHDTREAARLCRPAKEYEIECLYGVAREIVNADGGPDRAATFCSQVAARHRPRCFSGVGTVLAALHPDLPGRRAACRQAAGRYAGACAEGAGLTR